MTIIWPDDTVTIINNIRNAIGRDIEFQYVVSSYECPDCNLDPVTDTSDNSFCPTCSGEYWIDVISGYSTIAFISWGPSDRLRWESGGTLSDGVCVVQVELTDTIEDIIPKTTCVVVDSRIMEIKKSMRRGVQPLNRVLLSLIERSEE